jgi:hypothetical protein
MPFELIVGAAIGAAASSSSVRKTVRSGLVFGVSRALIVYDRVADLATTRGRGTAPAPASAPAPVAEAPAAAPVPSPTPAPVPDGKPVH